MKSDNIKFHKTKRVLEKFSAVLKQINKNTDDKELEKYFTEYILIVFYCEVENKLQDVLREALKQHSNQQLAEFINNTMRTIFKRVEKKDIEKTISYFGKAQKNKIQSFFNNKKEIVQKYKNFIENRHNVAHSNSNTLASWIEVKNIDQIGETIIQAVKKSLI